MIYNIYEFNKKNILDTLSQSRTDGEQCLAILDKCDQHINNLNSFLKESRQFYKKYNKLNKENNGIRFTRRKATQS